MSPLIPCEDCGVIIDSPEFIHSRCGSCWRSFLDKKWREEGCPHRNCEECSRVFLPSSGHLRHCPECVKKWMAKKGYLKQGRPRYRND